MNYFLKQKNKSWTSRLLLMVMIAILLVPILPFSIEGFEDGQAVAAAVYGSPQLKQAAIDHNKAKFERGVPFDGGGYDTFGFYDIYTLIQAGETVTDWVYNGQSLKGCAVSLADTILTDPPGSAKKVAQGYLAMKELGDTERADQLLQVLKGKQKSNGSFDGNAFSDIPAFEALSRAGIVYDSETAKTIVAYILSQQQNTSGAWPADWPDFQTTAQAIRSLDYFKKDAGDSEKEKVQAAIDKGKQWMKEQQNADGSFGEVWEDPVVNTAEVICTLKRLNEELNGWKLGTAGPVDYMMNHGRKKNGTFGMGNIMSNTYAVEAYRILEDAGNSASKYTASQVATLAAKNNKSLYEKGSLVDGGGNNFTLYDVYILQRAGIDTGVWKYNEKSMKNAAIELANRTLTDSSSPAKKLAYGYVAMKEIGETEKANQLLDILKARQSNAANGAFDNGLYTIFSNMPAFEALGRAGAINAIDMEAAIGYILGEQDSTTGAWPADFSDFQTTAQAIRSLTYMKGYVQDPGIVKNIQGAIDKAVTWLKANQQNDGSFKTDWDDPLINTAEVIYTLNLLNEDLNSWLKGGKGPVDYMLNHAVNEDGTFGTSKNIMSNTWALDACLMMGGVVGSLGDGNNGGSPGGNTNPDEISVRVKVIGKNKETLYGPSSVKLHKNDKYKHTPVNALHKTGLSYNYSGNLVNEIAGQKNAGLQGWMYMVNGSVPGNAAIETTLSDGDEVVWWYSTDPNEVPGGAGGTIAQSEASINVNEAREADEKTLSEILAKTGEAKLVLGETHNGKAYLSPKIIADLSEQNKSLIIIKENVQLAFGEHALMTEQLKEHLEEKDAVLEIGIRKLTEKEEKELLNKAGIGSRSGLSEIGEKVAALTIRILYVNENGNITTAEELKDFLEPVKVTFDLSRIKFNEETFGKMTGIRYEKDKDGRITPVKLGGSYHRDTKKYDFYTDQFSDYGILQAEQLIKIQIQINEDKIIVNEKPDKLDVPAIVMDNRTMVPIRFVAENLGAKVEWLQETKTVKITVDDKELTLQTDKTLSDSDAPAILMQGRTLVPLRYVSEYFDARVLWIPSTKTVEIVK